ncbi:MAG: NADH-quinone oxidoreductase subunit L [Candidatus Poribacteria bacterium]|nr:MAG: NADH-quinone oxidoreductase subunit L [Candidatus Poribacteria bacterium]
MELSGTLLAIVLFAPLVAFLIQILLVGRWVRGPRVAGAVVSLLGVGVPFFLVLVGVVPHLFEPTAVLWVPQAPLRWIDLGPLSFQVGLMVDNTTKVLLFMVTLVCLMIHLFSVEYMKVRDGEPEPYYSRFFAYLSLFTFAMILLTLSDNLLTLFIGWELMGLCSYLLIGFYYERKSAQDAAIKAFLTTRVGDVLLLIGLAIVWASVGSLRLPEVAQGVQAGAIKGWLLTLAGLFLFAGAVGKSAQFPLHTWLPDAMEGPTPVSALIHAATMVAAGVYLAARMLQVGLFDERTLLVVAYVGGFTALFAASIALVQTDIKRVLAYSTVSQLGYMMLAVGVGNYTAALFHLLTHAFFKACLFLGSGSVIHALHEAFHRHHLHADAQDMRNMGGLRRRMPLTFGTFLIATLAISGIPLTAGFLSKDAILAGSLAYVLEHPQHLMLAVFGFIAAAMTAFYMFRLVFWTFAGTPGGRALGPEADAVRGALAEVRESSWVMTVPLAVLAFFALWIFWSLHPASEGWIAEVLSGAEGWLPEAAHRAEAHGHGPASVHLWTMVLSVGLALLGVLVAALFYLYRRWSTERFAQGQFARVLEAKYGLDALYDWAFVRNAHRLSQWSGRFDLRVIDGAVNGLAYLVVGARHSFTWVTGAIDRYVVDGAVNGVAWLLRQLGAGFRQLQTGYIQGYLLVVFSGLVALAFLISAAFR